MTLPAEITRELWRRWDRAAMARGMTLEEFLIACVERELARERFRRRIQLDHRAAMTNERARTR